MTPCNFCSKPSTVSITVDGYPGRLCDTCTLEAQSEFSTAIVVRDSDAPKNLEEDFRQNGFA